VVIWLSAHKTSSGNLHNPASVKRCITKNRFQFDRDPDSIFAGLCSSDTLVIEAEITHGLRGEQIASVEQIRADHFGFYASPIDGFELIPFGCHHNGFCVFGDIFRFLAVNQLGNSSRALSIPWDRKRAPWPLP